MGVASIDLGHMADLVKAMEKASTEVEDRAGRLKYNLEDVWLQADALKNVDGVKSWIDDELPGLRRRLALARHIEAQTPGPQTFAQIDESKISTATPAEARERADRAIELFEDYDGDVPSAELVELMADNATDPYFAQRLATKMNPEKASEIILSFSSVRKSIGRYTSTRADLDEIEEFDNAYDSLLTSMGTSLGLATQNTGDLALDDDYAKQWLDAITSETAMAGQASALGLVVSRGDWSTDFLTTLAQGVYDYEREVGQRGMWHQRAYPMGTNLSATDPGQEEGGAPTGYTEYYDPLAGILNAVGRNPDAGHELFGRGDTVEIEADGKKSDVNAFMEYLIARRKWPVDDGAAANSAMATAMTPFEGGDVVSADIASDANDIVEMKADEIEDRRDDSNVLSDIGHLVLDGLGMVPVVGEPADAVNAIWYAAEGNVVDAGLSAAALVPFLGWGATGGKWTRRALTAAELAKLDGLDTFPKGFSQVGMVARADGVNVPAFEFTDVKAFNRAANNPHPNAIYVFKGMAWETDKLGRVTRVSGTPSGRSPGRDPGLQRDIGNEGLDSDVGFHLIADSLGGPTNRLNVVPGNGKPLSDGLANLNQGKYAKMERILRKALQDGKRVQVDIAPRYRPTNTTKRPDSFTVKAWIDGEIREFNFKNK